MQRYHIWLISSLIFAVCSIPTANGSPNQIKLVYPTNNAKIAAASTFLVGACPPSSKLTVNGKPVSLNQEGFFSYVVPLAPGINNLKLNLVGETSNTTEVSVFREIPLRPIKANLVKIAEETIEPKLDMGVQTGDLIAFSVHATPASQVIVELGSREIKLSSSSTNIQAIRAKSNKKNHFLVHSNNAHMEINQGLDIAYGKVFQRSSKLSPDLYSGFYKVRSNDCFKGIRPKFKLVHRGKICFVYGAGRITTLTQPFLAETKHERTVTRLGPGLARTTPLDQGIRLLVDGWQGDQIRCLYAAGQHVWIAKEELTFQSQASSGLAPKAVARTINIQSDDWGDTVRIPLSQRLPYQIEQSLSPNSLILKLYGVTSDTDWVTPDLAKSETTLIENVSWNQPKDDLYQLVISLKNQRQWGYWVQYEGTTLVLHVKSPPKLNHTANSSLKGLVICIDPGHGGNETGSMGCSGIKESTLNLAISLKLKQLLEQQAATVIMTRTTESQGPSLKERVELAIKQHVDLLISIHNNALPDGSDPIHEHGTSSYWYHPQSIELAKDLKNAIAQKIKFPDFGTRYQNLALARPSEMVAVLVEVGFMINPDEYARLINPSTQNEIAQALSDGIKNYFNK